MPVLSISLDFATDDGLAEEFRNGNTSDFTEGFYEGSEGNPAGSVRFDTVHVFTDFQTKTESKTFEAWGIPAGATITGITDLIVDHKRIEVGTWDVWYAGAEVRASGTGRTIVGIDTGVGYTGSKDWFQVDQEWRQVGAISYASTELMWVTLYLDVTDVSGTSVGILYDNITFDITYTLPGPAPDITLTGDLQAQDSKIAGVVSFGTPVPVTGDLQAQNSTMAGYLRSMPATTVAAKKPGTDTFSLNIDGVSVPLIKFTVKREAARETAQVVVPGTFEDILAAAAAIAINLQSFDVYGTETNIQLFSGTLDDFSTLDPYVTGNCSGAASWPATAVRYFENVSYFSDNGNGQIFRTGIDPDFNPGDVGMYGVRRINITRVTFSGNAQQSVMELSSFG
jgi:hypothetical protein